MGLFGPSPEELRLQGELETATTEKATVESQLALSREHVFQVNTENTRLQRAARLHDVAARALREAEVSGTVQISAEQTAEGVVAERYIGHRVAEIADEILDEREDMIRHDKGPAWDIELEASLRTTFENDGTFDSLETDLRAERMKEIADELRAAKTKEVEEDLDNPETRATMVAEQRKLLDDSGEFDRIKKALKSSRIGEWRDEAIAAAHVDIEAQLLADKETFITTYRAQWPASDDGERYIARTRRAFRKDWESATAEELRDVTDAKEFIELVDELIASKTPELESSVIYEKYLSGFKTVGIDTGEIPAGHTVSISLGTVKKETVSERDMYNRTTEKRVNVLAVGRRLVLTSLGENRFRVEKDTLADSESPYEKDHALAIGGIIHLGRKVTEKKQSTLEPHIRQDVRLFIDDDTSDPHITDMLLAVGQVSIDGVDADKTVDVVKNKF
jgi:hypothetical protein